MRFRIRHMNGVDVGKTFTAKLSGGVRGFGDAMALETFSNDVTPTIKCLQSFTLLVEVDEENNIL